MAVLSKQILLMVLCLTWTTAMSCQDRRSDLYLIPEGYVGWVRVDYGIKDAPPLPIEDGYYVVKFPATGHVRTSTRIEEGVAQDKYYYYSNGNRRLLDTNDMIRSGFVGSVEGEEGHHEYFFIGTEEQRQMLGSAKDKSGYPIVGPVNVTSDREFQK